MKKWKQKWVMCLECGDKVTNGMTCQCNGVYVTPLGEIVSVEGNVYEQKTASEEDERRRDSNRSTVLGEGEKCPS